MLPPYPSKSATIEHNGKCASIRDKILKRVEEPQNQVKRIFCSFFLFGYLFNNTVSSLEYTAWNVRKHDE